jgi:hypothetical protein
MFETKGKGFSIVPQLISVTNIEHSIMWQLHQSAILSRRSNEAKGGLPVVCQSVFRLLLMPESLNLFQVLIFLHDGSDSCYERKGWLVVEVLSQRVQLGA